MSLDDLLKDLDKAEGSQAVQRNYIPPGRHLIELESMKYDISKKDGTKFFLAKFELLSCLRDPTGRGAQNEHCTVSYYQDFKFPQNTEKLKGFLNAVFAAAGKKADKAGMKSALGEEQSLTGTVLIVDAWDEPQKKDPTRFFTKFNWRPATAKELEDAQDDGPAEEVDLGDLEAVL